MSYMITKPVWLKKLYGKCLWQVPTKEKVIYLTFDDGPHPDETAFVLDSLKRFNAKATFFCVGANVLKYPELYKRISEEGHSIGNHTHNHLDGWRTRNETYYEDVTKAKVVIQSPLFRPPHGHVTPFQVRKLRAQFGLKTVMWSIMSGDFDSNTTPMQCYNNVAENIKPGSIIVFHDNDEAKENMRFVLPKILYNFSLLGYSFQSIPE